MTKKIFIIGPEPNKKAAGIVTHIRNLMQYAPFESAVIFDVGSLNSPFKQDRLSLYKIISRLRKLRKLTMSEQGVVLINSTLGNTTIIKLLLILMFINKSSDLKLLVFFHGGDLSKSNSFWRIGKRILNKAYKFYFLSEFQKASFQKLTGLNNLGIYNNYSTSNDILIRKKVISKDHRFLFVGRLDRVKGIFEALEAFKELKLQNYSFHFDVVGDGKEYAEVKKYITKNELEEFVSLHGYKEGTELENFYIKADCLIFPTYHPEGFPYVFIEAMRAGLPLITTREGALTRLVIEGRNGYFVEQRSVDDLVDKIKYFMTNNPDLTSNCYSTFRMCLSKRNAENFYSQILDD